MAELKQLWKEEWDKIPPGAGRYSTDLKTGRGEHQNCIRKEGALKQKRVDLGTKEDLVDISLKAEAWESQDGSSS